jgi:hypothetical protein
MLLDSHSIYEKTHRIILVIQTAGFIPATSTKEIYRSHCLWSSPSEILNPTRRSASTTKEYIQAMKTMRRNHQKKRTMNQRTRSIQNVFVGRKVVEVTLNFSLHGV